MSFNQKKEKIGEKWVKITKKDREGIEAALIKGSTRLCEAKNCKRIAKPGFMFCGIHGYMCKKIKY
jgi:hypothetical protein